MSRVLAIVLSFAVATPARAHEPNAGASKAPPALLIAPFDASTAKSAQEAWARHLGKPGEVEKNRIGIELVLIPPAKFTMGSPSSEKDRHEDEDQVTVTLTKAYYLGKTEVTQRQWGSVMGTTPWKGQDFVHEGDDYPATFVTWEDARTFCWKLSEKEREVYRLPTEAEWEYACRAGRIARFSSGDDESQFEKLAWYDKTSGKTGTEYAHEVGRLEANPFGLFDMHGNVREWCMDVYATRLPGGADPLTYTGGSSRVLRGGSWATIAAFCRAASRDKSPVEYRDYSVGFRVARSLTEEGAPTRTWQEEWARYLGKSSPVEKNSIGMKMVLIPPGEFMMGSQASHPSPSVDRAHVTITNPFYLGTTEVTQGQWRAVMGTTPWSAMKSVREADDCAATYVNWDDAKEFCKKLIESEKETYRLPTEAEWEYACRAGTRTQFIFGDDIGLLNDYAWWGGLYGEGNVKGEHYAHEVGGKRANAFGLYDMHGNVLEWCEDVYGNSLPGGTDPLVSAESAVHVSRGGSWSSRAGNCRSAFRSDCRNRLPRTPDQGFRVARVLSK
jgi:formylglycine-generating enzyme required for sulfatase activity